MKSETRASRHREHRERTVILIRPPGEEIYDVVVIWLTRIPEVLLVAAEVKALARQKSTLVIARYKHVLMVAEPHNAVDEIVEAWQGAFELAQAGRIAQLKKTPFRIIER